MASPNARKITQVLLFPVYQEIDFIPKEWLLIIYMHDTADAGASSVVPERKSWPGIVYKSHKGPGCVRIGMKIILVSYQHPLRSRYIARVS